LSKKLSFQPKQERRMARATRCTKCGLMQMSVTGQCKKCRAPLAGPAARPSAVAPAPSPASGDVNPYAAPRAALGGFTHQGSEGLFRDGKTLVASHGAHFPDRCVKCNAPSDGYRLKRKLTWHPAAWYAVILVNLLVYAVVAMVVRKTSELHVGLCDTHRRRRRWFIGLGLGLPLLGFTGCSMAIEDPSGIWIGILGFVVGMVLLVLGTNVLTAERIDERFARIRGASPAFLASLPPFR
jgi:hypothetical protein